MSGLEDASWEGLLALLVELRAVNVALPTRVAEQDVRIAVQDRRIAQLERALSGNSGDCSMPPSGADASGRRPPARGQGKGGKRGKRPGAPGSGLAWREVPEETVVHRPAGVGGCGTDLAAAVDEGVACCHRVVEVPLTGGKVVQHDLPAARCRWGRRQGAARLGQVLAAPVSYRPNLPVLVVYLLVFQHVPVARWAQLVADSTGAGPSTGFIPAMGATAAPAVKDVVALIRILVTAAVVVGFDETTRRVGPAGTNKHVLSTSTPQHTGYWLGGGNLDTCTDVAVRPGFAGVAVHDRYSRYSRYDHPELTGRLAGISGVARTCCGTRRRRRDLP